MKLLALLALVGCGGWHRATADGGTEYSRVDGGWVTAGDGCSCVDEIQDQVVTHDYAHVLLECVPNPELHCDARTGMPDGGQCPAAAVCFGSRCCVWRAPEGCGT